MSDPTTPTAQPDAGRAGDWMQTYTGKAFWPLDPRPEEIDPRDIARSLSQQCRYAGHSLRYYSVAEHSVLMSDAVSPPSALWALLHDATEAYVVDVPRPLKPYLAEYKGIEARVAACIATRFGLCPEMPAEVKDADNRILVDERDQIMAVPPRDWNLAGLEPLGVKIHGWSPPWAEHLWLARFRELTMERAA